MLDLNRIGNRLNNEETVTEAIIHFMSAFCISRSAYKIGNFAIKK